MGHTHENMTSSNSSGLADVIDDDAFEPALLAVIAVRRSIRKEEDQRRQKEWGRSSLKETFLTIVDSYRSLICFVMPM